ncbi:transcriptional regulator [Oleiphilus messinensis]|uniref:Transcriptional regulator n=1 Tax=Oleiphilus messinensis TaxID=141451 RepID=A0A1Y0I8N8_9GAMM|nr:helix-turn-helix domain-containing protein [Oleiphilus messinensis]ARU56821.1 transcriptional regulator [Oleiphilus messinensis]
MRVGIIVTERCQASSLHTTIDLIIAANYAFRSYFASNSPLFEYELIGSKTSTKAYNGSAVSSITPITKYKRPDIVILPGAFESVLTADQARNQLSKLAPVIKVLQKWHSEGTVIASICTGNFIIASSSIAKGRPLTCHWISEKTAHLLYPSEQFVSDKLIIDHGDIVSAGGAMATAQLVLYLVSRFHSRELALATGKLMLVELNFDSQSRFAIFRPNRKHGDGLVLRLQKHIEENYAQDIDLSNFSTNNLIGARQLSRRFKKATGETPLSYLQLYRVEQVKIGLEATSKPVNALIWEVGYEDPTSFRRLFKRLTGITMTEYRNRFSS